MIEHPRTLNRPHLVRVESAAITAGTEMVWTPPPIQHIELIALRIQLTTDATVTNRRLCIVIGGVHDDDVQLTASGNQAASTIFDYWFLRGCDTMPQVPSTIGWYGPLPLGLIFQMPEQLRTETVNLQAGDQITAYNIRYMTWQDPVFG